MKITNLRINGIESPKGYRYDRLLCSFQVEDTKSKRQTAGKIRVSDREDFSNIVYEKSVTSLKLGGEALEVTLHPRTTYYYQIFITGENGEEGVSEIGTFETGKMEEPFWGEFIAPLKEDKFHPVLKKKFYVAKAVKRGRFYVTGVGLFEVYLNGNKLGNEYLMPYINDYERELQVMTFEVKEGLQEENCLEILLGRGWYMGVFGLELKKEYYGNRMAAIGELHLEYEDGSRECILTDESWFYGGSDIEDSGIYDGEIINHLLWEGKLREEKPVEVLKNPNTDEGTIHLKKENLIDRVSLPILVQEELPVQKLLVTPAGETVLDMGQNFAGFLEFEADLPKGTKVVFDFGEILQEGNFYNKNYRDAKSQFVYISDGRKERVSPHFTYFGFRYVRITGFVGEIKKDYFTGKALYSNVFRSGKIETANPKINRLYENTLWGLKSNFLDIPTDCPQRSERLGWTGDAQVFAKTACYHMDTRAFFRKFLRDLRGEQKILSGGVPNYFPNLFHKKDVGSVWGDIATLLPETLYQFYGSLEEMEDYYPLMRDWVNYIDGEDQKRGRKYLFDFGFTFGDWLALDGATPTSFKGSTDDSYIASVYYYRSVQIVHNMAARLENHEEEKRYALLEEKIGQAIFREYFTPSGRLAIDTQAAYVIALKFGVYIDRDITIQQFRLRLQKDCNKIKCGFVGAPLLCTVLAEIGLYEMAYDFLLKEGFPSWLYSVNLGATTVWERWNSVLADGTISDTGMNSLNHYAYGSVMEFVYAYGAGIRPAEPGFQKAWIEPHPDIRIPFIDASYDSVCGRYICNWKIEKDGFFTVHIEIPFHCSAAVKLPGYEKEELILESGSYDFSYMPSTDFLKPYHRGSTLARVSEDANAMEVLRNYVPAIAGIAASKEPELSACTLEQLLSMEYLPFEPEAFQKAVVEICEIIVEP